MTSTRLDVAQLLVSDRSRTLRPASAHTVSVNRAGGARFAGAVWDQAVLEKTASISGAKKGINRMRNRREAEALNLR